MKFSFQRLLLAAAIAAAAALAAYAASPITVSTNFDPAADFAEEKIIARYNGLDGEG